MTKAHATLRRLIAAMLIAALAVISMPTGIAHGDVQLPGYGCEEPLPDDAEPLAIPYKSANELLSVDEPSERDLSDVDARGKYPAATLDHILSRYKNYLAEIASGTRKPKVPLNWPEYRRKYVQIFNNRSFGSSFEDVLGQELGLTGDGWTHNRKLPASAFPAGMPRINRRIDFFNLSPGVRLFYELKSGADIDKAQLIDLVKAARVTGNRLMYIFGKPPSKTALDALREIALEQIDETTKDTIKELLVQARCFKVLGQPDVAAPGDVFSTDGTTTVDGDINDMLDDWPETPEQAEENKYVARVLGAEFDVAEEQQAEADERANAPAPTPAAPSYAPSSQAPPPAPAPGGPAPAPAPPPRPAPAPAPRQAPAPQQVPIPAIPVVQLPPPPVAQIPQIPVVNLPPPPEYLPQYAPLAPAPQYVPVPQAPAPQYAPVPQAPAPQYAPAPQAPAPQQVPLGPSAPGYSPPPSTNAGGIDLTTLQLRYVADTDVAGPGMQYAFTANGTPTGTEPYGGRRAAQMASDAFFVWLALDPNSFWVNLRPDEPDRIIDGTFGRTQAGQVLLEADLEMKNWAAKLQAQDTDLGRKYVDALQGRKCRLGRRLWIEPQPATVHEKDGQLYILDIPLTVNIGKDNGYDITPGTDPCSDQDPAITARNAQLYEDMIMPALIDRVNHGPEFADLRRVYASRVAAEWFRKRNAAKPTVFANVIGSGKIDKWTVPWDPREVFNRYLTSLHNGVASFSWTTQDGPTTMTWTNRWGGVDFAKVELKDIGDAEFDQKHPEMAAAANNSLFTTQVTPQSGREGSRVWLGGLTSQQPLSGVWKGDPAVFVKPPQAIALVAAATSSPVFYVAIALPVLGWLAAAAVMWRRRYQTSGQWRQP